MDNELVEIEMTALVYGGDAIGRTAEGQTVFVPFALPGERVQVRLRPQKRGYVRAELVQILRASPQRIEPRCLHFRTCGGCHYQHMGYAQQVAAKTAILREQMMRIGHFEQPPIQPMLPSPSEWNYRNTLQFHLSPNGKIGFQRSNGAGVVEIQECHLPMPALDATWRLLDMEPNPQLERIELRQNEEEEVLLTLECTSSSLPEFEVDLPINAVGISSEGESILSGNDYLLMTILGRPFRVSAGSFFQVNTPLAEAMVQHVLAHLPNLSGATVLDLYCGVGLFSAFLADQAARVIGFELSESACEDFAVNLDEFENVELYMGAAEQVLPAISVQPLVAVLDPPRAGLAPPVLQALLKMRPQQIIYISCDPSTLARDAVHICKQGYIIEKITPFDLFPQTFHIESITIFRLDEN